MSDLPLFDFDDESDNEQKTRTLPNRRKSQSEEDFQAQLEAYKQPLVQTETWLSDRDYKQADLESKFDRNILRSACEHAYYLRDYQKVIELCEMVKSFPGLGKRDFQDFDEFHQHALKKL